VSSQKANIVVRGTTPEDFPGIIDLCRRVYPGSPPWTDELLASHLRVFPEGQFVAVDTSNDHIVGMAASLIIRWDGYDPTGSWREFTANGTFSNHDPSGHTLYGAEVMVDPTIQRRGIGKKLYVARRELVERLGLLRIRAGARLRGYGKVAGKMTPDEYVIKVIHGQHGGPTLSFQLREGFEVIGVVSDYLRHDPESLGYAAVIEWINPKLARPEDKANRDPRFLAPRTPPTTPA
jgi:ribosomal protein S18 acetylase RimI-like enzyme